MQAAEIDCKPKKQDVLMKQVLGIESKDENTCVFQELNQWRLQKGIFVSVCDGHLKAE